MIRTYHWSAKYVYSPHEFAREISTWNVFSHLTYSGIKSYIVAIFIADQDRRRGKSGTGSWVTPKGVREDRVGPQEYTFMFHVSSRDYWEWLCDPLDESRNGTSVSQFIHKESKKLRHEGYYFYKWFNALSETAGYSLGYKQQTRWLEQPAYNELTAKIAFRLGSSCVVCGDVSRGDNAITKDEQIIRWWTTNYRFSRAKTKPLAQQELPQIPGADVFNCCRSYDPGIFPNPLCPGCLKRIGKLPNYTRRGGTEYVVLRDIAKQLTAAQW